MSHRAMNRKLYFNKNIEPQESPQDYVLALAQSPFKTHRRMAVVLTPVMENLLK